MLLYLPYQIALDESIASVSGDGAYDTKLPTAPTSGVSPWVQVLSHRPQLQVHGPTRIFSSQANFSILNTNFIGNWKFARI